jgi:hypothetical protein
MSRESAMISAINMFARRRRMRRESDPKHGDLFAERIARDDAAGLRTRLDQFQARGLWARLHNKR